LLLKEAEVYAARGTPESESVKAEPEVSIILPAVDEGGIEDTVASIAASLEGVTFEIVIVDDGSTDDTWAVTQRLSARSPSVRGIRLTRNFGHQAALYAGIVAAAGRAVVTMDADGQHPAPLLPEMVKHWRAGARVVQGIRDDQSIAFGKRWWSRAFYRFFSWLAQLPLEPGSADFRLMDRNVVEVLRAYPGAAGFLRGFVPWTGFDTTKIHYRPGQRSSGRSKFSSRRMVALARNGILAFSIRPLRLSLLLGLLTCGFALAYLVFILTVRLFYQSLAVPGWASIAGLLALLGGVQLLVLGIMGEYLGLAVETLRDRPPFIVSETCGSEAPGLPGPVRVPRSS
jgi:dolichol-phosphate mannosyltransferase